MRKVFRRSTALALSALAVAGLAVFVVATATASTKHRTASVAGLRPAAGHEVVRPLGAVRRTRFEGGLRQGRRHGVDQQRPQRPAEAEGTGAGLPRCRREGRHRDLARQRLRRVDREALHLEGRQGDRLRPPGHSAAPPPSTSRSTARPSAQAQANGVIAAMKAKGTYKASSTVAELWGGQTDQNAFWFKSGNDAVFNPLFKSGTLKKGPQQFVPDWDANNAATIFSQMLVKTNNNIQGVIAANDNIAGAVIADLKAKHLKPIPLSGQDAIGSGRSVHPRRLADRARSTSTCRTRRTPLPRQPSRSSRARSRRPTRRARTARRTSRPLRCRSSGSRRRTTSASSRTSS